MLSEAIVLNSEWEPREGYSFSREDEVSKRTSNGNLVWRNPKISVESGGRRNGYYVYFFGN